MAEWEKVLPVCICIRRAVKRHQRMQTSATGSCSIRVDKILHAMRSSIHSDAPWAFSTIGVKTKIGDGRSPACAFAAVVMRPGLV
jgi:hypothetical protein